MDDKRFDALVRAAAGSGSRRGFLKGLVGALAGIAVTGPSLARANGNSTPGNGDPSQANGCDAVCSNPGSPTRARQKCGCAGTTTTTPTPTTTPAPGCANPIFCESDAQCSVIPNSYCGGSNFPFCFCRDGYQWSADGLSCVLNDGGATGTGACVDFADYGSEDFCSIQLCNPTCAGSGPGFGYCAKDWNNQPMCAGDYRNDLSCTTDSDCTNASFPKCQQVGTSRYCTADCGPSTPGCNDPIFCETDAMCASIANSVCNTGFGLCLCPDGYQWSDDGTSCVLNPGGATGAGACVDFATDEDVCSLQVCAATCAGSTLGVGLCGKDWSGASMCGGDYRADLPCEDDSDCTNPSYSKCQQIGPDRYCTADCSPTPTTTTTPAPLCSPPLSCESDEDCSAIPNSSCSGTAVTRCLCDLGYHWSDDGTSCVANTTSGEGAAICESAFYVADINFCDVQFCSTSCAQSASGVAACAAGFEGGYRCIGDLTSFNGCTSDADCGAGFVCILPAVGATSGICAPDCNPD